MTEGVAVLRAWGGDAEFASLVIGRFPDAYEGNDGGAAVWWMPVADADKARAAIYDLKLNIATAVEANHPREITVAVATLQHEGRDYVIEQSFGYGYPADSAEFMFREGNYACDCNRRAMLSERYHEIPNSDRCGDSILLVNLRIEHRETETGVPPCR